LDIGAHRGIYSYWLGRSVGKTGRVIAFEPQPEMIAELKNFKRSFRARNLEIIESGLSDTTGIATLRRGAHTGGASIEPGARERDRSRNTVYEVPVTTLDTFFAERAADPSAPGGTVALIKCDVEGHEQAVFRGGRALLAKDRPALLFECQDDKAREGSLFDDLKGLGYRGWFFDGHTHRPVERFDEIRDSLDAPYLNYVFEPEEQTTLA